MALFLERQPVRVSEHVSSNGLYGSVVAASGHAASNGPRGQRSCSNCVVQCMSPRAMV